MRMKPIRLLKASEIECRVGTINEKGLSILLFKDARVDQKLLDESFTPMGWKRSHQSINGNLYCTVSVWDNEKGQWIDKQDVGSMANEEKEKSQASDSFKRACFNWGVGRELYTAPFIWVSSAKAKILEKSTSNGRKYYTSDRFQVSSIGYNKEREIDSLVVVNDRGQEVYHMNQAIPAKEPSVKPQAAYQGSQMSALEKELKRTGVALEAVLNRYHIENLGQMTPEMYQDALSGLKKSKSIRVA